MGSRSRRVTITIRQELLDEIKKQAPNLSRFFADAAWEHLKQERFRSAVARSAGAWDPADHPELATVADVVGYVEALRREGSHEG